MLVSRSSRCRAGQGSTSVHDAADGRFLLWLVVDLVTSIQPLCSSDLTRALSRSVAVRPACLSLARTLHRPLTAPSPPFLLASSPSPSRSLDSPSGLPPDRPPSLEPDSHAAKPTSTTRLEMPPPPAMPAQPGAQEPSVFQKRAWTPPALWLAESVLGDADLPCSWRPTPVQCGWACSPAACSSSLALLPCLSRPR